MMKYITMIPLKFTNKELHTGDTFIPKNEDAIKGLLAEGKVRPLSEVMSDKYQNLTDWLHQFDLGRDELKETHPDLYQDIQDAIERLDNAFLIEDMTAFQDALENIRVLYTDALFKCGRRI
jgi:hypothetical protein